MVNAVRYLVKKFYILCAVLLIGLAILVQGGRSLTPLVERYPNQLAAYLSEQLDLNIRLDAIRGEWTGLKPSLHVDGLRIRDQDGNPLMNADSAHLELNLISSVRHWTPVWGEIKLNSAELSLSQNDDGRWLIPRAQQSTGINPDDLWNFVRLGTRVEFRDTHLNLRLANGEPLEFVAPSLLLENRGDFHRLTVQVDVSRHEGGELNLVVEGYGDPTSIFGLETHGYLELNEFPALEPLTVLETALLESSERGDWFRDGRINARLWFNRGGPIKGQGLQEGYEVQGTVGLRSLSVPVKGRDVTSVTTELQGNWTPAGQWKLAVHDFRAQWGDQSLAPIHLGVNVAGPKAPIEVMTDRLDLSYWSGLLDEVGVLDGTLATVLNTLDPHGELRNTRLTLPRNELNDWRVKTELARVSVQPWENVPGFSGVSGFLAADKTGGHLDLDSDGGFSMYYAKTYDTAMVYQRAHGQIAWHLRPDNNQIYVNSGTLALESAREVATGSMWLSLPWKRNSGDIDLYVQVKADEMSAGLYAKYLPEALPDSLSDWLDRSISRENPGRVTNGQFVFRGTLNSSNPMARTYQLDLQFEDTELDYRTYWPALTEARGWVRVDDTDLKAHLAHGRVYNSDIVDTDINVGANPKGEGLLLTIDGQVDGIASDGLRLLRESALRQYVGRTMDGWYMHGDLQASLSLGIPLQSGQPGMSQDLVVDLDAPRFTLDHFDLNLQNLKGRIRYTDEQGLMADALTVSVFDKPTQVSITSQKSPDKLPQTRVTLDGAVEIDRLLAWTKQPALNFAKGTLDYETQIELTHRPATDSDSDDHVAAVAMTSDLEGVAVSLPAPFGKKADSSRTLHVNTILGEKTALIDVRYGDLLQALAQLNSDNYRLLNANLALGQSAELPTDGRLHLSGELHHLNLDTWKGIWQQYQSHAQDLGLSLEAATPAKYADSLTLSADIRLDEHRLGAVLLEDLELGVESRPEGWYLSFFNPALGGKLQWYEDPSRPAQLDLNYLRIMPERIKEWNQGEDAEKVDLTRLPSALVNIDELTVDEEDYGHWSFRLDSESDSIRFTDIMGEVRGLKLSGVDDQDGAEVVWHLGGEDGAESTRFSGLFEAGNMGQVLRQWGQPNILESQRARYDVRVSWDGAPWKAEPEKLIGDITLALDDGRFRRNPAGGSDGLLRLFAILNFDSLARRLRLDFSDLYQSGLAYDSIRGRAEFDEGTVKFREPLLVRSPSSRLQLTGGVDLSNEMLDARLIATLPVAGNLTFLTALVGGLPAAAGVFLVSKLFERQVDQATSISYTIRGDWDDPTIKFDRLFEGDSR